MSHPPVLEFREAGIYCPEGDFYIDPWRPVDRAVITHGHSDHARYGNKNYLCHRVSEPILRLRLGRALSIEAMDYGESRRIGGVSISLHPAGHIPGSAQVRVERGGEVWVVAGDYKTREDGISTPFVPISCHAFVTESTFGLPVYRWPTQAAIAAEINEWWMACRATGRACVLTGYSLGKAQRLLHLLDRSIGPVFVHPTIVHTNAAYREAGIDLPDTPSWSESTTEEARGAMVIVPPGAAGAGALRRFEPYATAHASGWMALRGNRRRLAVDRGFVVSDHADWNDLNEAIAATGARRIFVTHGQIEPMVKWLREQGYDASPVSTRFSGDLEIEEIASPPEVPG